MDALEKNIEPRQKQLTVEYFAVPQEYLSEEDLRALCGALKEGLGEVVQSEIIRKIINHVPVLGELLLAKGAITGKEGNRELPTNERVIYAIVALTAGYALFMASRGNLRAAATAQGISEVFQEADMARAFLRQAAEKLQNTHPELASVLHDLSNWEELGNRMAEVMQEIDAAYPVLENELEEMPFRD